jgi:hypothetical protein
LVPKEQAKEVPRCDIWIIAGHTTRLPKALTVLKKNTGCAFGEMYGCATGGGVVDDEDLGLVLVPNFPTPGIPGAPAKPADFIEDAQLISMVTGAVSAAKAAAKDMCKKCCCTSVWIDVEVRLSPDELGRMRESDRVLLDLEKLSTSVNCSH